ncbi:MAG: hypothetical protein KJ070_09285 [Verrucomicrobia bacterium]|nr:hypothetical protein [Verrucomicrobiota bacterium]
MTAHGLRRRKNWALPVSGSCTRRFVAVTVGVLVNRHPPNAARAGEFEGRENPLQLAAFLTYNPGMERTVHKARTFREAAAWDIQQQVRMTPRERWSAARQLRERVFGRNPKDVRACHATN